MGDEALTPCILILSTRRRYVVSCLNHFAPRERASGTHFTWAPEPVQMQWQKQKNPSLPLPGIKPWFSSP